MRLIYASTNKFAGKTIERFFGRKKLSVELTFFAVAGIIVFLSFLSYEKKNGENCIEFFSAGRSLIG